MKKRVLFIINPKSGVSRKHNIPELISSYLDDVKFDAEIKFTKYSGHGYKLAKEAVHDGYDVVCAVGGDGSVHNIGMALINADTILAVIPTGSGNGYARHFDIPVRIKQAILTLNQMKIRQVDVGMLNHKYFLGVAGFGFDGHISGKFVKRKKRGIRGYILLVLKEYFRYGQQEFEIEFGSGRVVRQKAFMASIANISEFGNSFRISPFADAQDGKFELILLRKPNLFQVPFILRDFFKGKAHTSRLVQTFRFEEAKISTKSSRFHADGEPVSLSNPIKIRVQPKALQIVVGENYA